MGSGSYGNRLIGQSHFQPEYQLAGLVSGARVCVTSKGLGQFQGAHWLARQADIVTVSWPSGVVQLIALSLSNFPGWG